MSWQPGLAAGPLPLAEVAGLGKRRGFWGRGSKYSTGQLFVLWPMRGFVGFTAIQYHGHGRRLGPRVRGLGHHGHHTAASANAAGSQAQARSIHRAHIFTTPSPHRAGAPLYGSRLPEIVGGCIYSSAQSTLLQLY